GTGEVEKAPEPAPDEEKQEVKPPSFGTANFVVLGVYLVAMLGIGIAASRRIKSARSFFVADGRLNYVLVGLSLLGTYLSALTVMGLPGMAYGKHDWTFMVQLPFLIITAIVITRLVLPRYRKAGVISVYEYLERRIHVSVRIIASVSFVIFAIARMGLVLYLPALAFHTVTGVSLPLCIMVMGLFITLYTVLGGIEAVVWTDAIQVVIFIVGALVTLGYIFSDIGVGRFIEIGMAHNKFRIIVPGTDIMKITTVWLILETIFQTIRIYGTQQDMAQRYMTTGSTKKANRSVWISILAYIPLGFIFYFIGTALFVFYKIHPDAAAPGKADPMYPHFIVNHLPAGVAGLLIAAIFAAAMSSIDSLMNSSSTVCVEDFLKRFSRKKRSETHYLPVARILTILWGVLAVGMALLFIKIEYVQIVWGKVMGISTNGILGLMALAFLPYRIHKVPAIVGFASSYVCLGVMMNRQINYLLWPVVGNLVCFLVAVGLNRLFYESPALAEEGS
ncbi:MAG: sodium/solute symporter, partial [Planctomycetes bacterium]|nr:sodium/solute symporter [Planctomycetota bacterium]